MWPTASSRRSATWGHAEAALCLDHYVAAYKTCLFAGPVWWFLCFCTACLCYSRHVCPCLPRVPLPTHVTCRCGTPKPSKGGRRAPFRQRASSWPAKCGGPHARSRRSALRPQRPRPKTSGGMHVSLGCCHPTLLLCLLGMCMLAATASALGFRSANLGHGACDLPHTRLPAAQHWNVQAARHNLHMHACAIQDVQEHQA